MIQPVIIAGGKGVRLWPVSREAKPKPFVNIGGGGDTLLQATLRRLAVVPDCRAPMIVCGVAHEALVRSQSAPFCADGLRLVLEPEGRNTAPAICASALAIERLGLGDEPMLVLPADHVIADAPGLARAVASAADLARQGHLVTFAITPDAPSTAYGYLKLGSAIDARHGQYRLEAFVEKPDLARATAFLAEGGYAWNSGMFMFRPSVLLAAFGELQPEILAACRAALAAALPGSRVVLDGPAFAMAEVISIDYAIMEKAANVATVVADLGWSDVGDWQAIWDAATRDSEDNARHGDTLAVDTRGSLLHSEGPLLVGIGLADMMAVATGDAVVVAPRSRAQDVKIAVDRLRAGGRSEPLSGPKVVKPWGSYEALRAGPGFQVKEIVVNPGQRVSLQRHKFRAEHWIVTAGVGIVTRGEERLTVGAGSHLFIPVGMTHRMENNGTEAVRFIEVQLGSYTGEDDIERLADDYGRA